MKKRDFSGILKVVGAALFLLAGVSYAMWFHNDRAVTVYSRDGTTEVRGAPFAADGTDDTGEDALAADSTIKAEDESAETAAAQAATEPSDDAFTDVFFEEKPVDINMAGIDELKTLTGIGDSKAAAIIAYREAHGYFTCIEDIMLVPGIKEGVFGKIKDMICVGDAVTGNKREE